VNSQGETRTRNPRINSPLLYRLSYLGSVINSHLTEYFDAVCAGLYTDLTFPRRLWYAVRVPHKETNPLRGPNKFRMCHRGPNGGLTF
jgi:hypothetical protein